MTLSFAILSFNPSLSPGAAEAPQYCYNYNTRGTYYAFCKRPAKDQFTPCQQQCVSAKHTV